MADRGGGSSSAEGGEGGDGLADDGGDAGLLGALERQAGRADGGGLVAGGNIVEDSFESAAYAAMGFSTGDGWKLSYEAVTPSWASYSGTRGQRVLYQRMIALCDGQYAAFALEYSATELSRLDPVVNRLVRSLKSTGGSC